MIYGTYNETLLQYCMYNEDYYTVMSLSHNFTVNNADVSYIITISFMYTYVPYPVLYGI